MLISPVAILSISATIFHSFVSPTLSLRSRSRESKKRRDFSGFSANRFNSELLDALLNQNNFDDQFVVDNAPINVNPVGGGVRARGGDLTNFKIF